MLLAGYFDTDDCDGKPCRGRPTHACSDVGGTCTCDDGLDDFDSTGQFCLGKYTITIWIELSPYVTLSPLDLGE